MPRHTRPMVDAVDMQALVGYEVTQTGTIQNLPLNLHHVLQRAPSFVHPKIGTKYRVLKEQSGQVNFDQAMPGVEMYVRKTRAIQGLSIRAV